MRLRIFTFPFVIFLFSFSAYGEQVPEKCWEAYYEGPGCATDEAFKVVKDNFGNIYVSGNSYGENLNIVTVKYDANGNQLWAVCYDGPENEDDYFADIETDEWGNVYVAGSSYSEMTKDDYITIKYDTNGNQLWSTRYNNYFVNSYDIASSLGTDDSGNVYVTGRSTNEEMFFDCHTIKYDSNGCCQWLVIFNGPMGWSDEPTAMAVDSSSNIYVTGISDANYATIKYDTNGTELWVNFYDGSEVPGMFYCDEARAITLDACGNVYVTGLSGSPIGDYATVKYSSDGNEVWVARYDGIIGGGDTALDVEVDVAGNVYVTGVSEGTDDFSDSVTIKYDSNGEQLWLSRYDGEPNEHNSSRNIELDNFGNVYIVGTTKDMSINKEYLTIKYDPNGNELWTTLYNGSLDKTDGAWSSVLDDTGNIYVTGYSYNAGTGYDYATIKYSPDGIQQWVAFYKGKGHDLENNRANAIAVDNAGNVYVTGRSYGVGTADDCATIKYDANGNEVWSSRFNNIRDDWARDIAVDKNNNVYITGYSKGTKSGNYLTIKYGPNGEEIWSSICGDANICGSYTNTMILDEQDNVYVSGYGRIVKYDSDGDILMSSEAYYNVESLKIDNQKNLYTCGCWRSEENSYYYITQKSDFDGNTLWTAYYNGPKLYGDDKASAIDLDKYGNVYVTGCSEDEEYLSNWATIKYDANGIQEWVVRNDDGYATDLIVDENGDIYVTGSVASESIGGFRDYLTIKYDSNGNTLWERSYNGPGNSWDFPNTIALDKWLNVYVAGHSEGIDNEDDYCIVKYDSNGNELWVIRHNGQKEHSNDYAYDFTLDIYGNMYITGKSDQDFCTVKYKQENYCVRAIEGDLTDDCKVDFVDLAILADGWLEDRFWDDVIVLAYNWLECNLAFEGYCW